MVKIVRAEEEEEEGELEAMDFPSISSFENLLDLEISNSIKSPYPEPFSSPSPSFWDFENPMALLPSPSPSGSTIAILFLTNSIIVLENGGIAPVLRYKENGGITPVLRYNVVMNPLKSQTPSPVSDSDPIGNLFVHNGYTEVKVVKNSFLRSNATMMKSLRTDCHESIRSVLASSGYTEVFFPTEGQKVMRLVNEMKDLLLYERVSPLVFSQTSRNTETYHQVSPLVPHMNHAFSLESTRPVEGEAINIDEGDFRSSASQTVNASGILLETNKRKKPSSIELEDLRPFFGNTREEAAKNLGFSKSTLKRICRKLGITRWPYKKSNKTGASIQSSPTEPLQDALPFNPHVQAAVQPSQPDASFNPPPRQLSTTTVAQTPPPERRMQDAKFVTIKAIYYGTNTIVKFDLPSSATKDDLEGKVAKKLNLKVGSFTIKYKEQEGELITVTDSEDLQYCIREYGSSTSITMLVQSTSSGSGPT